MGFGHYAVAVLTGVQLTMTSANTSRVSAVSCFGDDHQVPDSIEIPFRFELQNVDGLVGSVLYRRRLAAQIGV